MENVRPARTILGVLLVAVLGYLFFMGLTDAAGKPVLGKTVTADRVSKHFLQKNVSEQKNYKEQINDGIKIPYRMGDSGLEDAAANVVTSIVMDYRAFDTLGEVMVLFTSLTGLLLLFPSFKRKEEASEPGFIVKNGLVPLFLVVILVGAYVVLHGHLTPGGGFAGGAVIATGLLLLILAKYDINERLLSAFETVAGLAFLTVGLLGLFMEGSFLQNFLPGGVLGALNSSGTVLLINIINGLKVASELGSMLTRFNRKEK